MQEKLNEYLNTLEKAYLSDLEICSLDIQHILESKSSFEEFKKAFIRYKDVLESLNVIKYLRERQANEQKQD